MKMSVTVCNVCKRIGEPTQPYVVEATGRSVSLDLCANDAAPIEVLMRAAQEAPEERSPRRATKASTRRRRSAAGSGIARLVTPEEIERELDSQGK